MGRRLWWWAIPGVLALTGCVADAVAPSPTEPHESSSPRAGVTTSDLVEDGLADFRSCLGEAGVMIDEIGLDGLGRPRLAAAFAGFDLADPVLLDAVDRCASTLSTGALDLSADPALRELVVARLAALAACVRSHGVPGFPDPPRGFDGVGWPFPAGLVPWDDPRLGAALAACNSPPT